MAKITRRGLLGTVGAASLAGCKEVAAPQSFTSKKGATGSGRFLHGVASGDPTSTSVVIWTRVTPDEGQETLAVTWMVYTVGDVDAGPVAKGNLTAQSSADWTVKVNVAGLKPNTQYRFGFSVLDSDQDADRSTLRIVSGFTKTLPEGDIDAARLAVVSCSNWQHGHFNPYDHIARQDHFDALIHLGDYIYEYGAGDLAPGLDRAPHDPPHEIITLDDYRRRYAQYRTDPNLQAVHAKLPMIHIWDDHEIANDAWVTGAENHDPDEGEGSWEDRKAAALKAYYEWMPVREPAPGRPKEAIFKTYDFGDLARLVTLETRLMARSESLVIDDYFGELNTPEDAARFREEVLGAPDRQMLGAEQLDYVVGALKESKEKGQRWRILGNQILMSKVDTPDLTPHVPEEAIANIETLWAGVRPFVEKSALRLPFYLDCWDGYPGARERLYTRLQEHGLTDNLVITGDSHEFWACDLDADNGTKMGIEICTSSVSSKTLGNYLGEDAAGPFSLLMTRENEPVRFYDNRKRGYIDLQLTKTRGTATFWAVDTVMSPDYTAYVAAEFTFKPLGESLSFTGIDGVSATQRVLYMGLA